MIVWCYLGINFIDGGINGCRFVFFFLIWICIIRFVLLEIVRWDKEDCLKVIVIIEGVYFVCVCGIFFLEVIVLFVCFLEFYVC